jgi:hypothetical protein
MWTADCSDPRKVKPLIKIYVSPWTRRWTPAPIMVQVCEGHKMLMFLPMTAANPLSFIMSKEQITRWLEAFPIACKNAFQLSICTQGSPLFCSSSPHFESTTEVGAILGLTEIDGDGDDVGDWLGTSVGVMVGIIEGWTDGGREGWKDIDGAPVVAGLKLGVGGLVNSVQESASKSQKPLQSPFSVERLWPPSIYTAGPASVQNSSQHQVDVSH